MAKDTTPLPLPGIQLVSINERKKLNEIQVKYPKLEIIIGKANDDDKPVKLDLAQMDADRIKIFNSATEMVLGKRIDLLTKPMRTPIMAYVSIISFLVGVAACFFVYNI